jgi:signal transduction histidine kinase
MQQHIQSSRSQFAALRRFGNNIGIFWRLVCYAGIVLALLSAWLDNHAFYSAPKGWLALGLAVCYLAVYSRGSRWIAGADADTYWKMRFNSGCVLHPWRAVALWAALLALAVALISLDENFLWLIWIPFGMSLSLLSFPRNLLLVAPTTLLAMGYYHALPANFSPPELLKFAGVALGFVIYGVVIYLPIVLLRNRFQRERMFQQLEQSHHELEAAHQRLEQAAAQERELAVLRERGRLARDIHDTLGHSLALMAVKLEAAQRLRAVDPDRADHEVAATQAIARSALGQLRAALADLRAPAQTQEPLGVVLVHAAEECAARANARLTCAIAPDVEPISDKTYKTLLRTGLEALANVERHAQARFIAMALVRERDMVMLRIEDDGVGILATNPPQRVGARVTGTANDSESATSGDDEISSPSGHYGITGMRERTVGAGGSFAIGAGANGYGTRIEARLPAQSE